jgi:hypothetical protein
VVLLVKYIKLHSCTECYSWVGDLKQFRDFPHFFPGVCEGGLIDFFIIGVWLCILLIMLLWWKVLGEFHDLDILYLLLCNVFYGSYSAIVLAGRPRGRSLNPDRGKIFLNVVQTGYEAPPPERAIQWGPGTVSPGAKWPEREADHSTPTSAGVNNMWIYTCTHPYFFMA